MAEEKLPGPPPLLRRSNAMRTTYIDFLWENRTDPANWDALVLAVFSPGVDIDRLALSDRNKEEIKKVLRNLKEKKAELERVLNPLLLPELALVAGEYIQPSSPTSPRASFGRPKKSRKSRKKSVRKVRKPKKKSNSKYKKSR